MSKHKLALSMRIRQVQGEYLKAKLGTLNGRAAEVHVAPATPTSLFYELLHVLGLQVMSARRMLCIGGSVAITIIRELVVALAGAREKEEMERSTHLSANHDNAKSSAPAIVNISPLLRLPTTPVTSPFPSSPAAAAGPSQSLGTRAQ